MTRIMQLTAYGALNATIALVLDHKYDQPVFVTLALSNLAAGVIATILTFLWFTFMGTMDHYVAVQVTDGNWQVGRYGIGNPMYLIPGVYKTHKDVNREIKRIKKVLGWYPSGPNCVG